MTRPADHGFYDVWARFQPRLSPTAVTLGDARTAADLDRSIRVSGEYRDRVLSVLVCAAGHSRRP
jgi:hypothetical protein